MKHIVFRILAGLVLLAAIAGIGFFAYTTGVAHGAALDVKPLVVDGQVQPPIPMYAHGMVFHHAMPLFGCFGLLIPLFLFFLALAAMRHLFWGPRWWGHHMHPMHGHGPWGEKGPWGEGMPPMFAEWHRRAHTEPSAADDPHRPDVSSEEKK
jgi:hypothetical protein